MNTVTKQRNTRVLSEKVRLQAEANARRAPLVVRGIGPGKLVTIGVTQFAKIDVDPSYQRGKTAMVPELVRVLQAGGVVRDPVTLCKRPWSADPERLWIVDGWQRVCAHQQVGVAFSAMVHESESLTSEKAFFLSLNNRKALSADLVLKSWEGISGKLIRGANENKDHPLFDRVHLEQGSNKTKVGGVVLARAMLAASAGLDGFGPTQRVLARLDHALTDKMAMARAEHFMRLVALAFHARAPHGMVLACLGEVAHQKWLRDVTLPKLSVIEKLRTMKWDEECPMVKKFHPVVVQTIKSLWR